jgi:hypothetical protein
LPALFIYLVRVVPAEIRIRILQKSSSSKGAPLALRRPIPQISDALINCIMNVSSIVDVAFTWMKRSFVCSAVTQFDTTNASKDSDPLDEARTGVILGLVSFASGGLRWTSSVCPYYFQGGAPHSSRIW